MDRSVIMPKKPDSEKSSVADPITLSRPGGNAIFFDAKHSSRPCRLQYRQQSEISTSKPVSLPDKHEEGSMVGLSFEANEFQFDSDSEFVIEFA